MEHFNGIFANFIKLIIYAYIFISLCCRLIQSLHLIVKDLNTFVDKAIPDTKLTLKKYLDVKFEYLSFCLKLKEMDDEEIQFANIEEPLYRVETGNYEYRYIPSYGFSGSGIFIFI